MARTRVKLLLAAAALSMGCAVLALQLLLARSAAAPSASGNGLPLGGVDAPPHPPPPLPTPALSRGGDDAHPGFAVFTSSCKIPDFDPWDASVRPHVRLGDPIHCGGAGGDLTLVSDDGLLSIEAAAARRANVSYCVYKEVLRVNGTDDEYDYSTDVVRFVEPTRLDKEFVKVTCYDTRDERLPYCNFYARVQPLPPLVPPPQQQRPPPRPPNVLLVGLDGVSRLNFARQFPETRRLLLDELGAVELLGYTKVADNTFVNLMPLFVGLFADEAGWSEARAGERFDAQPLAWRQFAQRARYRTLFAEDAPEIAIWNYAPKRGFRRPPADHYYRPLALAMEHDGCAAAHMWSATASTVRPPPPSSDRDCFGSRTETAAVLDYVEQFVRAYGRRGEPSFAFAFLTRVTHSDVNKRSDAEHASFLRRLMDGGLLARRGDGDSSDDDGDSGGDSDTLVIYFSDHGARYGPIVGTYVGKLEERMPALFVVPPRRWLRNHRPRAERHLALNGRRLSTPFDVHATLMDLLATVTGDSSGGGGGGQQSPPRRGVSLFDIIPESRTCADAGVLPHWCTCQLPAPASIGDEHVQAAARAVVRHVNALLVSAEPVVAAAAAESQQPLCAELRLESVVDAMLARSADEVLRFRASVNDVLDRRVYFGERARGVRSTLTVTVRTAPGGGLFAATLSHDEESGELDVLGEVTRLNAYGAQSACVRQHALKKLCYCSSAAAAASQAGAERPR